MHLKFLSRELHLFSQNGFQLVKILSFPVVCTVKPYTQTHTYINRCVYIWPVVFFGLIVQIWFKRYLCCFTLQTGKENVLS